LRCEQISDKRSLWFPDEIEVSRGRSDLMNQQMPRVSIGFPVFNCEDRITEAVESILSQDYSDFELIISDNASTDSTADLCETLARVDKRIRFTRQTRNIGANQNFSWVHSQARGEFFMWAAHDDHRDRSFVERCVAALDDTREAVLAVTDFVWLNASTGATSPYVWPEEIASPDPVRRVRAIVRGGAWIAVYGLIRRDALAQTRPMRSLEPIPPPGIGPDYVLIELSLLGPFVRVPRLLFQYSTRGPIPVEQLAAKLDPESLGRGSWFWWWLRDLWRMTGRHLGLRTRLRIEAEAIASARARGSLHNELCRYNMEYSRLALRDRQWTAFLRLRIERWLLRG
jgi:glycosyltransferase involved in cell wall biosynthesis